MHELDDRLLLDKVVASLESQLGTSGMYRLATGNEFIVLRADLADGPVVAPVVIKVPKDKIFSNVNDTHLDSRKLLQQELAIMRHARANGIAKLPEPRIMLEAAGYGALVMSYVPGDGSRPDQWELGRLLATVHAIATPDFELCAQEGKELPELIAGRLVRRWRELSSIVEMLPRLPSVQRLVSDLRPVRQTRRLLHMDFRQANFRIRQGEVLALLDWSNALVGHPALEMARVAETGETDKAFLEGYKSVRPLPSVDRAAETIFRLDTAVMLALVFLSEDPDPSRAPAAVDRVRRLCTGFNA